MCIRDSPVGQGQQQRGQLGVPEMQQLGQAEVAAGEAGGQGQGLGDRPALGAGGLLGLSCQGILRLGRVPEGTPDGSKVSSARDPGEAPGGRWRPPS